MNYEEIENLNKLKKSRLKWLQWRMLTFKDKLIPILPSLF